MSTLGSLQRHLLIIVKCIFAICLEVFSLITCVAVINQLFESHFHVKTSFSRNLYCYRLEVFLLHISSLFLTQDEELLWDFLLTLRCVK